MTKLEVKISVPRTHKDAIKCYVCDGRGHRAVECPSKASTSRNEPFGHGRRSYCFYCNREDKLKEYFHSDGQLVYCTDGAGLLLGMGLLAYHSIARRLSLIARKVV